jgi:hypothetical protein
MTKSGWSHSIWIASVVCALFVALQAATLNYGTRINDLPYIRDYRITSDIVSRSSLNRDHLVGSGTRQTESLDVWMTRFKLYSIEADEILAVLALARIKPAELKFDPGLYQYGGAFLYPLGAWYFALKVAGLIQVSSLESLLEQPQLMDDIWIAGRALVLGGFLVSAVLLFMAVRKITSPLAAIALLVIFLFSPASIMFSQIIKPHWLALVWTNGALLIAVNAFVRRELPFGREATLAIFVGLAVGSTLTFSLFAVFLWFALAILVSRRAVSPVVLVRVPAIALAIFMLTNPYYVLNWTAFRAESVAAEGWFTPAIEPRTFLAFLRNSLLPGFGICFGILMLAVASWEIARGTLERRLLAVAVLLPIAIIAILTANLSTWTVNFRYIPYVLPIALVMLASWHFRYRDFALVLCAAATVIQSAPLKLAYFDENEPQRSTRLLAAAWIDSNIPASASICMPIGTLAPYDVPPFRFDLHPINTHDCSWIVRVERDIRFVQQPPRHVLVQQFTPRWSPQSFPLVWGHINPQISIYRTAQPNG